MRILFLNRAYPPDVEATGQYLAELAEDLTADGHQVSVLCGRPNFARLEGRVFPFRREDDGAAEIWRAWGTRWPKGAPLGRMANQASFFALATAAARRIPRADVVVSLTDPPFLGLLGLRLKRRWRVPLVYWCMDLYPDVARVVDMAPAPLAAAFERVQRRILAGADLVLALADDMAERLLAKGVERERIAVARNWVDTRAVRPLKRDNPFRAEHGLDGQFVAMYSGNFGYSWDLDAVLDAAARLRGREDIVFALVGGGSRREAIAARVRAEGLSNVRLLPYAPKERLAESLSAADVHLVPMRRGVYGTVVPSKVYGILATGTPLAVLGEAESEPARVVAAHGCGWRADPGDAAALGAMIVAAAADGAAARAMGARGRAAAEEHYTRSAATRRLGELLRSTVEGRPPGSERGSSR